MASKQTIPPILYENDRELQFESHRILTVNQIGHQKGHFWKMVDGTHLSPYGESNDPKEEIYFQVASFPDIKNQCKLICIGDYKEERFLHYQGDKIVIEKETITKIDDAKTKGLVFIEEQIQSNGDSEGVCLKPFHDQEKVLAFKDDKPTIIDRQGEKGKHVRWRFLLVD